MHGTNDPRGSSLWIALVVILSLPVAVVGISDAQDITTVVGGYFVDGVPGGELSILPQAMTFSPQEDLYFLDARNERIWKVGQEPVEKLPNCPGSGLEFSMFVRMSRSAFWIVKKSRQRERDCCL